MGWTGWGAWGWEKRYDVCKYRIMGATIKAAFDMDDVLLLEIYLTIGFGSWGIVDVN